MFRKKTSPTQTPAEADPPADGDAPADASKDAPPPDAAPAKGESGADVKPQQQVPPLSVNAQYIKDLSFEAPATPAIFAQLRDQQPQIKINIDVKASPLRENVYEVALNIHADCRLGETVAFLLELSYAGVFTLNVQREHLQALLLIECPRLLFPFARNILADVSRDGGFPPLMLGPVDFVAMYQNQIRELAARGGSRGAGDTANA